MRGVGNIGGVKEDGGVGDICGIDEVGCVGCVDQGERGDVAGIPVNCNNKSEV